MEEYRRCPYCDELIRYNALNASIAEVCLPILKMFRLELLHLKRR